MGALFFFQHSKINLRKPKISVDNYDAVWYIIDTAREWEVNRMYSYHNRIRQRINNGELVDHYFTNNYPRIGEALVLVFNTSPFLRPIRPHKWPDYTDVLKKEVTP